jgi:hypothetical protein
MTKEQGKVKDSKAKQTPLTSLADLQKLVSQRFSVDFVFNSEKCSLEVRRLTPAEEAKIAEIIELVTPSVIKGRTPEEDRVDLTNPKYIKEKTDAAIKARAQALYWSVPCFAEAKSGLTDLSDIASFVQGQLTESILDILWKATRQSSVALAELVNFT